MKSKAYLLISKIHCRKVLFVFSIVENLKFDVVASRSILEPPTIHVTFNSGLKDDLELNHYKLSDESTIGCNYIGRLRNDPTSSVAVTGCLNEPEANMEITIISSNSRNQMFEVDFNGYAQVIHSPFQNGGT